LSREYDWIPLAPGSALKSCPAQSSQAGTFGLAVMLEPQCRDNFVIGARYILVHRPAHEGQAN